MTQDTKNDSLCRNMNVLMSVFDLSIFVLCVSVQGFQMIKYSKNGSPGEAVPVGSSPQYPHTAGLMRSRPQVVHSVSVYPQMLMCFNRNYHFS